MKVKIMKISVIGLLLFIVGCGDGGPTSSTAVQAEVLFRMNVVDFNRCAISFVNVTVASKSGRLSRPTSSNFAEWRIIINSGQHNYSARSDDGRWTCGATFLTNQPLVKLITFTCGRLMK